MLDIDGQTVTYDKSADIPVGANPYNVDITPNGKFAIIGSTGAGKDNADPLTTIAITGPHPHVTSIWRWHRRSAPGALTQRDRRQGRRYRRHGKYLVTPLGCRRARHRDADTNIVRLFLRPPRPGRHARQPASCNPAR